MGQLFSKLKSHIPPSSKVLPIPEKTASSNATMGDASTKSSPVPMQHYEQATTTFQPPLIAHDNHFLGDVWTSDKNDPEKAISCGIYRFEPGHELVYPYHYHEMKIIIEGSATLSDAAGNKVNAKAGDIFYFPKGSVITFKTDTGCKAFYCGQRKEGDA